MKTRILKHDHRWPLLQKAVEANFFAELDLALAEQILSIEPEACEPIATFLCYLSAALRAGHLCVSVDQTTLQPALSDVALGSTGEDAPLIAEEDLKALCEAVIKGASSLPPQLVTEVTAESTPPQTAICRQGSLLAFQRYWSFENQMIARFRLLLSTQPDIHLNPSEILQQLEALQSSGKLLPQQAKAISTACEHGITFLCGGPGTGKTYTAGQLIRVVWSALSDQQRARYEIALAAPTGKAAANLENSLTKAIGNLPGFPALHAQTLHSLLGMRNTPLLPETPARTLSADLLLIDESSMIDVHLMRLLLLALKPGARLILLGDPHQLPPVSGGTLFADLVAAFPEQVTTLHQCLRTDLRAIVDLAAAVKSGEIGHVHRLLTQDEVVRFVPLDSSMTTRTLQKAVIGEAQPHFLAAMKEQDPQLMLEAFQKFRLLSSVRHGPLGVETLNHLLTETLQRHYQAGRPRMMPIIMTSNDASLELSNGEVGLLVQHNATLPGIHQGDYALFPARNQQTNSELRRIPGLLLGPHEAAYCLSVHKSQGSEFDKVLLLMPEGTERFGRELLYTAITRAKKGITIWGNPAVLDRTLTHSSSKMSIVGWA